MPPGTEGTEGTEGNEKNHLWALLPSFDPAVDPIREYIEKVKFLDSICPRKDRKMMAPRLAMLCKGTAWGQVRAIPPEQLTDETNGVKNLLAALASWEETSEMRTYELFEKAMYRTTQRSDESFMSYVNRLQVAMNDLGNVTVKQCHAFLLLRQSALTAEDRKRVLTMTGGDMDTLKIEKAMRTLATSVLNSGEPKKKIYPTNFVEPETSAQGSTEGDGTSASIFVANHDDEENEFEIVEDFAQQGDADALHMLNFEKDLTDLFQEVPDLHSALVSYQEARTKIMEKKKSRGFWPGNSFKSKGKGFGSFKGGRKGGGKGNLLARIARTHCKLCGEKGHWRAECPNKDKNTTAQDTANFVMHHPEHFAEPGDEDGFQDAQVIFEQVSDASSSEEDENDFNLDAFIKKWKAGSIDMLSQQKHEIIRQPNDKLNLCEESMIETFNAVDFNDSIEHALWLIDCKEEVIQFFSNRLAPRTCHEDHPAECLFSKTVPNGIHQSHQAILDTGASRSVIGQNLWEHVLKSLPAPIRNQIRTSPSKVGFRFGNNQITYSKKKVQIPILTERHRIWLVVEVVPAETPFLLSIQAMKSLGAQIDLSSDRCYLKRIHRELNLSESKNGLYLIDLAELCMPSGKQVDDVYIARRESSIPAPPGLSFPLSEERVNTTQSHANPTGDHADGEDDGRDSHGMSPSPSHDPHEPIGGDCTRTGSESSPWTSHDEPSGGSANTEDEDRAGFQFAARRNKPLPKPSSKEQYALFSSWRPIGGGGTKLGFGIANSSGNITATNISGDKTNSTSDRKEEDNQVQQLDRCKQNIQSQSALTSSLDGSSNDANAESGESISRQPSGIDIPGFGVLGQQEGVVGQDPRWSPIRRGLRESSQLCRLDQGPTSKRHSSHDRLHHVHPVPRKSRTSSSEGPIQLSGEQLINSLLMTVDDVDELNWIMSCRHHMPANPKRIDLLEVYTEHDSRMAKAVIQKGGTAKRFTKEDGDLSTYPGQVALLKKLFLYQPRHVWLAPECGPWGSWSRFNQMRSVTSYDRIHEEREKSRKHLRLCALIFKIQIDRGDHCHLENPGKSEMWGQPEVKSILKHSKTIFFDQCRFDLKHPETEERLQKRARVQTTSDNMVRSLDERFCDRQHQHAEIAGSCHFRGKTIAVSRFAAYYPLKLANQVASAMLLDKQEPIYLPIMEVTHDALPAEEERRPDDLVSPNAKRPKHTDDRVKEFRGTKREHEETEATTLDGTPWDQVVETLKKELPKSGSKTWTNFETGIARDIKDLCTGFQVQMIMASKGREKYIVSHESFSLRRTVVLNRMKHEIIDLGTEEIAGMSRNHQGRKAFPAHVMVCIFGEPLPSEDIRTEGVEREETRSTAPDRREAVSIEVPRMESTGCMPASSWTSAAVTLSGPKYLAASEENKAVIRKLHANLSHPTSERLAKHLREQGAEPEIIDAARDYLCPACAERRPPQLHPPGNLKDARDFNQRISMDGFEWKSQSGLQCYVIHFIDEATQFHLGRRTVRDSAQAQQKFNECWISWAGTPQEIMMDSAGEFISETWKTFLQHENIKPILTAGPWQRGRIERHGGIIKEMLNRIDQDKPITNEVEFDRALLQSFRAKNALSAHCGYSPEQAVLGKATRLPASIASDEDSTAHLGALNETTEGDRFKQALELRTLARRAFIESDNSQAIRRAMLRRSRGEPINWQNGQPCMFWDKRKSPNMLAKGKWCGPAQVVMTETKGIVWVTHLNRLLRCASDNLRPVSIREYHQQQGFVQQADPAQLRQLANELQQRLQSRSGMFQFSDLTEIDDGETPEEQAERLLGEHQPEEEPNRRDSIEGQHNTQNGISLEPYEIPVPDTPLDSQDGSAYSPTSPANSENMDAPNNTEENIVGDNAGISEGLFVGENRDIVHNALIVESVEPGPVLASDEDTLWTEAMNPDLDMCSFEFDIPMQQVRRYLQDPIRHTAFLTAAAKKSRAEVKYSTLSQEDKELFQKAKQKELSCWLETSAVRKIARSRIHPDRIMTSRWILTWKPDQTQPRGVKAKARLVVRGYQDPEAGSVASDSPTLTRDGRMLLLQQVCSRGWTVQNFDITTAFLRGRSDGRMLAMDPVEELRKLMNMSPEEVCLLGGNAYGRVDAPLLFYKEFRRQLESVGFEAHPLDGCLFLLRDPKNPQQLDGILGTHVDDGIGGGNQRYEEALRKLQETLPFGQREFRKFRFTGIDVEQLPDNSIKLSQGEYIHKIITDCKSLYDLVTKIATPNCEEWRTTVEVMLIKEQSAGHTVCRWISTAIMLADCLTKPMEASFLRTVLQLGRFRIYDEAQTLQNNAHKKIAQKWLGQTDATPIHEKS